MRLRQARLLDHRVALFGRLQDLQLQTDDFSLQLPDLLQQVVRFAVNDYVAHEVRVSFWVRRAATFLLVVLQVLRVALLQLLVLAGLFLYEVGPVVELLDSLLAEEWLTLVFVMCS